MKNTLDRLIWGRSFIDGQISNTNKLLATTGHLDSEDAESYLRLLPLQPLSSSSQEFSQVFGITQFSVEEVLVGRSHFQQVDDEQYPVYEYAVLPLSTFTQLQGNLQPLWSMFSKLIDAYAEANQAITPLEFLESPAQRILDEEVRVVQRQMSRLTITTPKPLLNLLAMVLQDNSIAIQNYEHPSIERIHLIETLLIFLPPSLRSMITFATNIHTLPEQPLKIVFVDDETLSFDENWHVVDWQKYVTSDEYENGGEYTDRLLELWDGDLASFIQSIYRMDDLLSDIAIHDNTDQFLTMVTERQQIDEHIEQNVEEIEIERLKSVFQSNVSPQGELRQQYLKQLLKHSLYERDTEVAEIITSEMDESTPVDYTLYAQMQEALQTHPDSIYVLIRTRLSKGIEKKWLQRLDTAARRSLEVAIQDGDSETISSWLNLISREPTRYGLADVLADGILSARQRAYNDANLSHELIVLAIKRAPELLPILLEDEQLTKQLADILRSVLQDRETQTLTALATQERENPQEREIFLAALVHFIEADKVEEIGSTAIQALWAAYAQEKPVGVAKRFRPEQILNLLISQHLHDLSNDALETLLMLTLSDGYDDLFIEIVSQLNTHQAFSSLITTVLEQSQREIPAILDIINNLSNQEHIAPQQVANIYIGMLNEREWNEDVQQVAEYLARILQKNPSITTSPNILWKILETAAATQIEPTGRTAIRRLLTKFENTDIEEMNALQLSENLIRLYGLVQWNDSVIDAFIDGFRNFTRNLPLVQLQRLEKTLEDTRASTVMIAIVQTSIALRKAIGKNSLLDFAQAIQTTYITLDAVAQAFDPEAKKSIAIDPDTLRADLLAREDELPVEERLILATNLKEISQLIASMADKRSKPSILGSDEALERQIAKGDFVPSSAIDLMKWLSGFLENTQPSASDSE